MPPYIDQPVEDFINKIYISNLPSNITAKEIHDCFRRFGHVIQLSLKRRLSTHSATLRKNPAAILTFECRSSIDQIMAERPLFINDCQVFVNRCLPITRRYPYETYFRVKQILIRTAIDDGEKILPGNDRIRNYLRDIVGGHLVRLERLDDQTIFIEFDDYDPVDLCCLLRPHYLDHQLLEIEKVNDEQQVRRQVRLRAKSRSLSMKLSPNNSTRDVDTQSNKTVSPALTLSNRQQMVQLQSQYSDLTNQLEQEHEQRVEELKNQWKTLVFERIRFQRLALDYQDESQYLQDQIQQYTNDNEKMLREQREILRRRKKLLNNNNLHC